MLRTKKFFKEYAVFITLIVFSIILSFVSPHFLTPQNITNVIRQTSMVIIVGVAVNLLMFTGNIDLSVGSQIALVGVVMAKLVDHNKPFPLWAAILIAFVVGVVCGLINGLLSVRLNISGLIITLGTMYLYRGVAYILSESKTITVGLPPLYNILGQGYIWIIPLPVIVFVIMIFIFLYLQNFTRLGLYSYSIGSNLQAAKLSGVPVRRVLIILYTLIGVCCGLTGVIQSSRTVSAGPTTALGFEFDVIIAILLGGTAISGGSGNIRGMVFGALVIGVLRNAMNLLGLPNYWRYITTGAIFILAIVLNKSLRGDTLREEA